MEINEVKIINGKKLKCIRSDCNSSCEGCYFNDANNFDCLKFLHELGDCSGINRRDGESVIFIPKLKPSY